MLSYYKFGPVVQEEMSFKEKFTDGGRQMLDEARSQYLTLGLRPLAS